MNRAQAPAARSETVCLLALLLCGAAAALSLPVDDMFRQFVCLRVAGTGQSCAVAAHADSMPKTNLGANPS